MSVHCEICGEDMGKTSDLLCRRCRKGEKSIKAREFHAHARERRARQNERSRRGVPTPIEFDDHELTDGDENNIYDRIKYLADHDGV